FARHSTERSLPAVFTSRPRHFRSARRSDAPLRSDRDTAGSRTLAMSDRRKEKTPSKGEKFDTAAEPEGTIAHERRRNRDRRQRATPPAAAKAANPDRPQPERRARKERRRRIDPTTFEKQYTDEEIEFMNAMQRFKMQSGRSFPTPSEVLKVAHGLGYRKVRAHVAAKMMDGPRALPENSTTPPPKIS